MRFCFCSCGEIGIIPGQDGAEEMIWWQEFHCIHRLINRFRDFILQWRQCSCFSFNSGWSLSSQPTRGNLSLISKTMRNPLFLKLTAISNSQSARFQIFYLYWCLNLLRTPSLRQRLISLSQESCAMPSDGGSAWDSSLILHVQREWIESSRTCFIVMEYMDTALGLPTDGWKCNQKYLC